MDFFRENMALLLPIVILELVLIAVALRDLVPRPAEQVTGGNKLVWGLVIVFVTTLGPLAYLAFGRRQEG